MKEMRKHHRRLTKLRTYYPVTYHKPDLVYRYCFTEYLPEGVKIFSDFYDTEGAVMMAKILKAEGKVAMWNEVIDGNMIDCNELNSIR